MLQSAFLACNFFNLVYLHNELEKLINCTYVLNSDYVLYIMF